MKVLLTLFFSVLAPASQPSDVDPQLWKQMIAVDSRAADIHDLVADFEQSKITPMLKKPLVSRGTIRATPTKMLWDTTSPEPTVMLIDESAATIYYPKEKLEEIYPITGQLGSLAASPLPRLDILEKNFHFVSASVKEIDPSADESKYLGVLLTPIDPSLREHIDSVRVLLDREKGFMIRCEITDSDGDKTVISFANVRTNTNMDQSQLSIHLPKDVKVERPLENLPAGN